MSKSSQSNNQSRTSESATVTDSGDRAWKVAQLAAILAANIASGRAPLTESNANPDLASKKFDRHFAGILRRAETLLSWAEGEGEDVHAYQLFQEDVIFTESRLAATFKRAGWSGLAAKGSVESLMRDLLRKFKQRVENQKTLYDQTWREIESLKEAIDHSITMAFEEHTHCSLAEMPSKFRDCHNELTTCMSERLHSMFSDTSEIEVFYELDYEKGFLEWCFPPPSRDDRAERLYRPYEIFKRCAIDGWEKKRLVRPREQLKQIPFPPEDLKYRIFSAFRGHLEDIEKKRTVEKERHNASEDGQIS